MAESKPEQEPSIEEILASIRQIISDDDEQQPADAPKEEPVPAAKAAPPPAPEPEPEEDVLDLTSEMQEEPQEPEISDEDLNADFEIALAEINETLAQDEPQSLAEPEPEPEEDIMPAQDDPVEDIISKKAETAAISSMAKLATGMPISKPRETPRQYDGVTLEDIVRDLLYPMLREWMDDNLPPMVERLVQKELEKLARKAMDN